MAKQTEQSINIGGKVYTAAQVAAMVAAQEQAKAAAEAKALSKSVGITDLDLSDVGNGMVGFTMSGRILRVPTEGESKRNEGTIRKSLTGGGSALVGHIIVDGQVYTATVRFLDYMGKNAPAEVLASL